MSTLVQGKVPMPESNVKDEPPVNDDDDDDDEDDVRTRAREHPCLNPEPRASTSSRNIAVHKPPETSSTGATCAHATAFRWGFRVPGGLFVTHQMRGVPHGRLSLLLTRLFPAPSPHPSAQGCDQDEENLFVHLQRRSTETMGKVRPCSRDRPRAPPRIIILRMHLLPRSVLPPH